MKRIVAITLVAVLVLGVSCVETSVHAERQYPTLTVLSNGGLGSMARTAAGQAILSDFDEASRAVHERYPLSLRTALDNARQPVQELTHDTMAGSVPVDATSSASCLEGLQELVEEPLLLKSLRVSCGLPGIASN